MALYIPFHIVVSSGIYRPEPVERGDTVGRASVHQSHGDAAHILQHPAEGLNQMSTRECSTRQASNKVVDG